MQIVETPSIIKFLLEAIVCPVTSTVRLSHCVRCRQLSEEKNAKLCSEGILSHLEAKGNLFSFESAWRTLQGYEVMHMIRKGQMHGVEKGDSMKQVAFIASLFGVVV